MIVDSLFSSINRGKKGLNKGLHPVQAGFQFFVTVAVGQADIALRGEAGAGDGGYLALLNHPGAECGRIQPESGDIHKHIERALGPGVGQPHGIQPVQHIFPALAVDRRHVRDLHLQGGFRRFLPDFSHMKKLLYGTTA